MATESFCKSFIITSEKEVDSIIEAMEAPEGIKIDRILTSPEREKEGIEKLKKMFKKDNT